MTLTWLVTCIDKVPTEGGLSKVCKKMDVMLVGEIERGNGVGGTEVTFQYGRVTLNSPDSGNFIDFDSLTDEICCGWAKDVLGTTKVNEMETEVNDLLKELQDGTKSNLALPWWPSNIERKLIG